MFIGRSKGLQSDFLCLDADDASVAVPVAATESVDHAVVAATVATTLLLLLTLATTLLLLATLTATTLLVLLLAATLCLLLASELATLAVKVIVAAALVGDFLDIVVAVIVVLLHLEVHVLLFVIIHLVESTCRTRSGRGCGSRRWSCRCGRGAGGGGWCGGDCGGGGNGTAVAVVGECAQQCSQLGGTDATLCWQLNVLNLGLVALEHLILLGTSTMLWLGCKYPRTGE